MELVLTLARADSAGRANAQICSQAVAHREDICRLWVQELRLALKVLQVRMHTSLSGNSKAEQLHGIAAWGDMAA